MAPDETKPRLVFLITLAQAGGAQMYVASLLPAVQPMYEVTVMAHGPGLLLEEAKRHGVPFVPLKHLRRELNPVRDVIALGELVRLFRRLRPDIVHVNSSKAGIVGRLAAALARVPVRVFTVHGWAYSVETGFRSRVFLSLERLLCRITSLIICVSHVDRELGVALRTCRKERSTVIWNAVDVPSAPKATHTGDVPLIVSVGRLQAPQKDFLTLLQALAALPPKSFRAIVVGDGPDREHLTAEATRLGLDGRVEFLGHRGDVLELLARSDIFVLASTYESLPMSIIEAMAAGLPVVASNTGGVPELVIDGETGTLVPPRAPGPLASALLQLVSDPGLRRTMGEHGLARAAAHFDLPRFHAEHLGAYDQLVRSSLARS